MQEIPNFPQIPKRWDQLLFVAGLGLMYFNQKSQLFFLLGILLFGVGIIIAMTEQVAIFTFKEERSYEERKSVALIYFCISGLILFGILVVCGVFVSL